MKVEDMSMAAHLIHCGLPDFEEAHQEKEGYSIRFEDDVVPNGWRLKFPDGSRIEFTNRPGDDTR